MGEKKEEKNSTEREHVQLLTCDGLAFRLGCGALLLAFRNKFGASVAGAVSALRLSAAKSFPAQGSGMETPPSVQWLTLAGLLGLVCFLLREANETEETNKKKEEDEKKETAEKPIAHSKKVIQLVTPDGLAFRFALGALFLAAREACAPSLVALAAKVRAAPAAVFPMNGVTLEAPSCLQLLAISVLLATFAQLILSAEQEDESKREEEQENKEDEDKAIEKKVKTPKKDVKLVTLPGFARRLSLGTLLMALREFYLGGSWDALCAFVQSSRASLKYTPLASMKLETPLFVCLFSLAGLCCSFAALVRSAEAEETKSSEKEEEEKAPPQHVLVSADRIALRFGACCGGFGLFEAARASGILSAMRALSSTGGFPPAGASLETSLPGCLLCLAVLCCGFAVLVRSAEAEETEAEEKKESSEKKEENARKHMLISADGIALRLGACCGGFGIFEAVRTSGILSTLRAASKSFASPVGGFPSAKASLETPAAVCLLCLAALCCGFAALVRSADAEEKNDFSEKKEKESRQHTVVSVDRIALRLGACCGGFGIFEAARTSVLPVLANAASLSPELAMGGGLLVLGTGLVLTDNSRSAKAK